MEEDKLKQAREDKRTLEERIDKAAEELSTLEDDESEEKRLYQEMGRLTMDLKAIEQQLSLLEVPDNSAVVETTAESRLPAAAKPCVDILDQSIALSSSGKQRSLMKVKPPRYKKEGDIWIFIDRFEQYLKLSGDHDAGSVEVAMLSLVDDDKMYRKLKTTFASLPASHNLNTSELITAIRSGLYPGAESRTLRDAMSQMKQKSEETTEDYTMRIEVEAAKAFSPLEQAVKNEACLSALSNGLSSLEIRRRLKEAEVKDFDQAARLAIKLDHIYNSTPEHPPLEEAAGLDVLAVNNSAGNSAGNTYPAETSRNNAQPARWSNNNASDRNFRPHQNIICYGCGLLGHIRKFCRAPTNERITTGRDNYRRGEGDVQCWACGGLGHFAYQCANRENRGGNRRQDQRQGFHNDNVGTGNNAHLNEQTTGQFPVHASRQRGNQ